MKRRTLVWFYMLSMQTKRSVKVESKVGPLLNRLIQIFWFYASITFLQCNIHRNYGFIRVLSQTPRMGVFIPVHSICRIPNPVPCNILPADSPRNFTNAYLLAATARNLFQSGIGRPSMKLSHFRTYNVSCRIGPCIRNTWIKQILKPINGRHKNE
jgi:hypothetical protein